MHDLHVGLGEREHFAFEYVHVFHAFIFHQVGETLLLHTGHIENIGIRNDLFVECRVLLILDAMLFAVELILLWHGEFLRCDEMKSGVEMAHGHNEGVDGAAVFEIAHHINVQVLKRTLGLVDGIKVEQALGWMLVGTVASVDNGHGGYFAGVLCGTFNVVPHGDDVGIVGNHQDGVFQGLALGNT